MRIRVRERLRRQQAADRAHMLDDLRVGVEHAHAGKLGDLGRKRPASSTGA